MSASATLNRFTTNEFANNPEPRCPCVILIDKSDSMQGGAIRELNEGMAAFASDLATDPLAAKRVELAVVSFGPVEVSSSFHTAHHFIAPELVAYGHTPMGEAIELGLDLLEERKDHYKRHHIPYYRPWVFLITDGAPSDNIYIASEKIRFGEMNRAFSFFAVGVDGADMAALARLSVRAPLRLKELRFRDMFLWLSNSLRTVSQSRPGEGVPLRNPASPDGWAQV
jgi:uncharacterized protein YegL